MKIPKSIKICGVTYKIKYDPKYLESKNLVGQIDYDACIIYLTKKNIANDAIEVTFIHELLHGTLLAMSNKLKSDEIFINQMSSILHQIIKQLT